MVAIPLAEVVFPGKVSPSYYAVPEVVELGERDLRVLSQDARLHEECGSSSEAGLAGAKTFLKTSDGDATGR